MTGPGRDPERIRVLVVEDSPFMRTVIRQILHSDPQIEVVGHAADGLQAVEAVASLAPDVVTMGGHMPRADGLAAVARIMAERPTPILMLSAATRDGSAAAIRGLELGAVDFIAKPSARIDLELDELRETMVRKVKVAARVRPVRTAAAVWGHGDGALPEAAVPRVDPAATPGCRACVVIAASTGGPAALLGLIPALPGDLPASVLVVQHMPAPYTAQLARELAARSALVVREAADGERLAPGTVHVAPGSADVVISRQGAIGLRPFPRTAGASPSADLAMSTVARHAERAAVGVVLTGMGADGALGVEAIAQAGGRVIAQDEASSVVYGMPGAAARTGFVNVIVPLDLVAQTLRTCVLDPNAHRGVSHALPDRASSISVA